MRLVRFILMTGAVLAILVALGCAGSQATTSVAAPSAAFSVAPAAPVTAQAVTFTDVSTGSPTTWSWSFGDGASSSSQHPSHTFSTAGTYAVTLTATNAGGSSTKTQSLAVTQAVVAPVAAFSFLPAAPALGQTVTFTDTTTNTPTAWAWTFGDGGSSSSQSPTHAYTTAGTFTVTLIATNAAGSNTKTQSLTVTQGASFSLTSSVGTNNGSLPIDYTLDGSGASPDLAWSNPPAGTQGYAVLMTTLPGDGTTLWNWVLHSLPGSTRSLVKNTSGVGVLGKTSHTVTAYAPPQSTGPGAKVYTFTVYALSAAPSLPSDPALVTGDVLTQAMSSITLGSASLNLSYARTGPMAGFSALTSNLAVAFTDASGISTASRSWSFGDGTSSTETNPTHTYATAGTYSVTLTATNAFGSNVATKSVTVASSSAPVAAFSYVSASGSTTSLRSEHAITFTDTSTHTPTSWAWDFGDGTTSTERNPVHRFTVPAINAPDNTQTFTVTLRASNGLGSSIKTQSLVVHQPEFNLYQGISDEAQGKTISFSGFAMLTGNLYSQTFFPPGKVADYTGFQYLRDNDPGGMGHNTSFVTKVAQNIIYLLSTTQIKQLADLAVAQQADFRLYGYKRYTLMKAFRRLLDGNLPTGTAGLSLTGIKSYSNALYLIDGQISYDRAVLYANIIKNMSSNQLAYMDAMKGAGWGGWPTITTAMQTDIDAKMKTLPKDSAVLVMTYAGDIFSWYAGSVDADVYFCPERHGTYYGGFYMKDAPAIGHEGYAISTTLTAEAGSVLLGIDGSNHSSIGLAPYYVTQAQANLMAGLALTQKNNLYAGTLNIVSMRTQIATLLRTLLLTGTDATAVRTQVLALSGTYGALDGENNYNYTKVFASVYNSLTEAQKTALAALRASIMKGTYADGTPFDFTTCSQYYCYSDLVTAADVAAYISDTATASLFE